MSVSIDVVQDPAQACARLMVDACRASAAPQIVLAGGSTPKAANELFAQAVRSEGLDLSNVTFWLGDDRAVPPDDDRSNFKMIRETLLDPLADVTVPVVHRIEGELGYAEAADRYERLLRDAGAVRFDLLLLGIGSDGHTLSLFPGKPGIHERSRLVVGVPEAGLEPFVPRVSFTLSAVALASHVLFLAAGTSKADALGRAFGPGASPDPAIPSSMIPTVAADVTLLVDAAAAAELNVSPEETGPQDGSGTTPA
jgi:6-phosphogluconolactonase